MKILVIGGGAAGFFAAIACAEANPRAKVMVLEKNKTFLSKVKISGGGRCNVTHACFEPKPLAGHYPRGGRALLGPFHIFQPKDTVAWFEARGVKIKTEPDGRMFPVTNNSQTIIDCLLESARKAGVQAHTGAAIASLSKVAAPFEDSGDGARPGEPTTRADGRFAAKLNATDVIDADAVLLATGGNPQGLHWAQNFGHRIVPPVPSLFTFTIDDPRLAGLAGISVGTAEVSIEGADLKAAGPLLITHWGLSGPAVLKLSAFGARILHGMNYQAKVRVSWTGLAIEPAEKLLTDMKTAHPKKIVDTCQLSSVPQRLWEKLARAAGIDAKTRWGDVSKIQLRALARELAAGIYTMTGKSAFKEEFVTAGGVALDEVNFKTMESKICPGLFFAGEILDIDGVTGGFNFQNAWTTGYLAGRAMAAKKIAGADTKETRETSK